MRGTLVALSLLFAFRAHAYTCEHIFIPDTPWSKERYDAGLRANLAALNRKRVAAGITIRTIGDEMGKTKAGAASLIYENVSLPVFEAVILAGLVKVDLQSVVYPPGYTPAIKSIRPLFIELKDRNWTEKDFVAGLKQNAALISNALERTGADLNAIARRFGIDRRTLTFLLRGEIRLSIYRAIQFAEVLQIDPILLMVPEFLLPFQLRAALNRTYWTPERFSAGVSRSVKTTKSTMRSLGLSYSALADLTGIKLWEITYLLSNETVPDIADAALITGALKVDLRKLVFPADFEPANRYSGAVEISLLGRTWSRGDFNRGLEENLKLIKLYLKDRGVGQIEIAKNSTVQRGTWIAILNGHNVLRIHRAIELGEFLGIDPILIMVPQFLLPGELQRALANAQLGAPAR